MKNYLLHIGMVLLGLTSQAQDNTLLYKISGNGLTKPSYLFGTIHLTCDATLDAKTLDAMDKTSQLYLELDMDDPNLQSSMMSGMMMKDKTMTALASEADIKIVDTYLKDKLGMPVVALNNMKPFMISSMMLPLMLGCPAASIEMELVNVSKKQNEEIYGLETVAEQLAVFDAIPYQVQMDELVKSVKDKFESDKKELQELMTVYKSKDVNQIMKMMEKSDNKISSQYQDLLLNNRNKSWIPKIASIAKDKPTFFGVGAAHLGGSNGVIALLKKQGFKVDPVQ